MNFRARPYPRTISDSISTLFVITAIPIIYWFELWIVIPALMATYSMFHILNLVVGTFIMLNIIGNMLAVMMFNTSIVGEEIIHPPKASSVLWKFCVICETVVPPRSRHCSTCGVCILKRDHHCMFTGCCIGHNNQRFFMYWLFYMFIGAAYSTILNIILIWSVHDEEFFSAITLLKMILPLIMLAFESSTMQFYLIMNLLSLVGTLFTFFLLRYHFQNVLCGCITHEAIRQFDLGPMENIRIVFGKRWYLTWISAFVQSELPFNGINWQQIYERTNKNL